MNNFVSIPYRKFNNMKGLSGFLPCQVVSIPYRKFNNLAKMFGVTRRYVFPSLIGSSITVWLAERIAQGKMFPSLIGSSITDKQPGREI